MAVVSGFTKEVGLLIQNDYEKQWHGKPSLTDQLKAAAWEFFFKSDISCTMPGAKEEMVVWDEFGKWTLHKYYLTMYLHEAYAVDKKMKKCAACLLSASLDQKIFFF